VHIQALYPADGILPVISSKLQLLFINLASVPGGQLVNSPTTAILERWLQGFGTLLTGIFLGVASRYFKHKLTTIDK